MAKEAIRKIKETEDHAAEILKDASEEARARLRGAEDRAALKEREVLEEARLARERILETAKRTAEVESRPIVEAGEKELAAIQNPDPKKVEAAVQFVIERIVNVNGNR